MRCYILYERGGNYRKGCETMRRFIIVQLIIIVFGLTVCYSIKNEQSTDNYLGKKGFDSLKEIDASVYMIPEEDAWLDQTAETYISFFIDSYDGVKANLFDKEILVIEPTDDINIHNNCLIQNVKVVSIIDGKESLKGQTVKFIYSGGFFIESHNEYQKRITREQSFGIMSSKPYSNKPTLHLAGLNIMKPQHKYFIFAQSMELSNSYTILCADKQQYTWMDITSGKSVPMIENSYQKYIDNEIFTDSQVVINDYYRLKKEVFEYYNIDDRQNSLDD